MGYHPGKGPGTSHVTGVPPERTWDQWKYYEMEMGYPKKGHGISRSITGWRWGTPAQGVNRLLTLPPVILCTRAVITAIHMQITSNHPLPDPHLITVPDDATQNTIYVITSNDRSPGCQNICTETNSQCYLVHEHANNVWYNKGH